MKPLSVKNYYEKNNLMFLYVKDICSLLLPQNLKKVKNNRKIQKWNFTNINIRTCNTNNQSTDTVCLTKALVDAFHFKLHTYVLESF